jgi:hypothetical protein
MELVQASKQWASRPNDERFLSLDAMLDHFKTQKLNSRSMVKANRELNFAPVEGDTAKKELVIQTDKGEATPTNWSFGQLATLANAPSGYLRTLPTPIVADLMNYGLKVHRDVESVGVLLTRNDNSNVATLRAATGPNYGRIWNAEVVKGLIKVVGDGATGAWRVPGEFGEDVTITKQNTTLYGSDRDMFIFLADERNRIEVPDPSGGYRSLARGFFVFNSEVGKMSIGVTSFLFDFVCFNRIVWGAQDVNEIRFRHSKGAPWRYIEEIEPALKTYAEGSVKGIEDGVKAAQARRIDNVDEFLNQRFSKNMALAIQATHIQEEGRPVDTLWDATTAISAQAKTIVHQDARINLEREAGKIMELAA